MLRTKDLCNCTQALVYKQALQEIRTLFKKEDEPELFEIIEEALATEGKDEYPF